MLPSTVESYLSTYGPLISEKVRTLFQPLHNPSKDKPVALELVRPLLDAQAHVVAAVGKAWKKEKSVILAAECGSGKSVIFSASCHAHANGRPYRVLVFTPDHIVAKFAREIRMTIPGAEVFTINTWRDTFNLPKGKPKGPFYCIVGRNCSKWLSMWKPAYKQKQVKTDDGIQKVLCCPKCGQELRKTMDKDGKSEAITEKELNAKKMTCTNVVVDCDRDGAEIVYECGESLWQFYPKIDRWSPAKIIHDKFKYYFDYFILDECFVGDTLVFMENQEYKEINKIQPGDMVMSYDHKTDRMVPSKVVRVIENPTVEPLVKVTHSKGSFVCTERHHIYANGKYTPAGKLSKGDVLYAETASVPEVRKDVHSEASFQGDVLQSQVCGKSERRQYEDYTSSEGMYSLSQDVHAKETGDCLLRQKMLIECTVGESGISGEDDAIFAAEERESTACMFREHEEEKQRPRVSAKVGRRKEGALLLSRTRRKWQGNDDTGTDGSVCAGMDTNHGNNRREYSAASLQGRCRESSVQDCNRNRRSITQLPQGKDCRQEEGGDTSVVRVDCDSIHQRSSDERSSDCDRQDQECIVLAVEYSDREDEYVYDLEVENTHCYFAGGVLVHNCQEVKSDDNLQANAAGTLIASCKKVIAGTGTLIGGYAKDVRAIMFRLVPHSLKAEGLTWKDSMEFNRRYGLIETTYTNKEGPSVTTRNGRGRSNSKNENVKPGTMPTLYARHLIGSTVFLSLKDVADNLPPFREIPCPVPLGDIQASYSMVEDKLRKEVKELLKKKNRVLLGKMLHTLLCYPDHPYNWKEIGYYNKDKQWIGVVTPPALPANKVYPKEKKLLEIIRAEKATGRQVWVFVEYTGKGNGEHPVMDRIAKIVQLAGFSVKVLDSDKVKLQDREKWIAENGVGVDVIISHPKCVATGLDFFSRNKEGGYDYNVSSLVFYEEGYELVPMRQASRRAWRIGQLEECRVYYLYYEGSMQERAMNLMGRKMAESLAIEGNFTSDGLDAILADHDTASMELAKSLAEKLDFGATERTWSKVDSVENASPKRQPHILPKRVMDKKSLLEALRAMKARERIST